MRSTDIICKHKPESEAVKILKEVTASLELELETHRVYSRPDDLMTGEMIHFSCTLKSRLGEYQAYYSKGIGHLKGGKKYYSGTVYNQRIDYPDLADVVYSFISDAECGDMNFDEFCDNFGYDEDSIRAKKIHEACDDTRRGLRHIGISGDIFNELLELQNN